MSTIERMSGNREVTKDGSNIIIENDKAELLLKPLPECAVQTM